MQTFVSHSHKDAAICSAICLTLDAAKIVRWDPFTMTAGFSLAEQLHRAIQGCKVCVFIATRRSIECTWCLAELGAFRGGGTTVIFFVADPDLSDESLPPQLNGTLHAHTAQDLIRSIRDIESKELERTKSASPQEIPPTFYASSGDYGNDNQWAQILEETSKEFDVMGITLLRWRHTGRLMKLLEDRATNSCQIRILLMHEDNPAIHQNTIGQDVEAIRRAITDNFAFFKSIASRFPSIEVRRVRQGCPHFSMTRTDKLGLVVPYVNSDRLRFGPLWQANRGTSLYSLLKQEFEYLWFRNSSDGK